MCILQLGRTRKELSEGEKELAAARSRAEVAVNAADVAQSSSQQALQKLEEEVGAQFVIDIHHVMQCHYMFAKELQPFSALRALLCFGGVAAACIASTVVKPFFGKVVVPHEGAATARVIVFCTATCNCWGSKAGVASRGCSQG